MPDYLDTINTMAAVERPDRVSSTGLGGPGEGTLRILSRTALAIQKTPNAQRPTCNSHYLNSIGRSALSVGRFPPLPIRRPALPHIPGSGIPGIRLSVTAQSIPPALLRR